MLLKTFNISTFMKCATTTNQNETDQNKKTFLEIVAQISATNLFNFHLVKLQELGDNFNFLELNKSFSILGKIAGELKDNKIKFKNLNDVIEQLILAQKCIQEFENDNSIFFTQPIKKPIKKECDSYFVKMGIIKESLIQLKK